MINFDDSNEKKKTMQELSSHNLNWLYISDHSYRLLIIGGLGSRKANALLNLITTSQILIKYICMLKIHMKLNTNF